MTVRGSKVLSAISLFIPLGCLILCAYLAVGELKASHEVGAGAAQGDLGIFMVLTVITPTILFALLVSVLLRRVTLEKIRGLFVSICILALLALAWNWLFLYFVLRA
jgi:hypothetical protein